MTGMAARRGRVGGLGGGGGVGDPAARQGLWKLGSGGRAMLVCLENFHLSSEELLLLPH